MSRDRSTAAHAIGTRVPALSIALLLAAPVAHAQEDGPIVITTREQFDFLQIADVRLAYEFLARRQIDEVEPANGPKTRDNEDLFRHELEVTAEGFLGHPNLVELDLGGSFRFDQEDFDFQSTGRRERTNNDLLQYDVSALILRDGKSPVNVFARRSQTTLSRQFSGSLDSTVEEYGASLTLRSDLAPSRFEYRHREEEQTNRIGIGDFFLQQDTVEWRSSFRPDAGQLLTWDYSYDNIDQGGELRRTTAFERHDGLAIHNWDFGPTTLRHNLRSSVKLFKETGDFPTEQVRVDETLRLRHDPDFETRYNYLYDWQDRSDTDQTFHRGGIGFRHNLFESLVTTGNLGVSFLDIGSPSFRSDQRFGGIDLDYTKKIPAGRLEATASFNMNWQDDSERGAAIQINDEARVFPANDRIVIMRQNIEPGSVVVTDAAGIVRYIEGIDYDEQIFPDRLEIRRRLTGNIAAGEVVLIDYRIGPEPANRTTTLAYGISVRYDIEEGPLSGLGLYARYREQDQDRTLEEPGFLADDIEDLVVGVDYDIWRISLSAERQWYDSTLSPFDATRLEARYFDGFARGSGLTISASYDEIDRTEENIRNRVTYVSGRWHQQLNDQLELDVELIWRDESDSAGTDVTAFEQRLDLEWQYRQTTVYASVRNSHIDSDATDTVFQSFLIGVRREF